MNNADTDLEPARPKHWRSGLKDWLRRLGDFVFGYDYFIAHAWHKNKEGHLFAERLGHALQPNLRCFLDSKYFPKGAHWTLEGERALSQTSVLIVAATPPVFRSEAVLGEVEFFAKKNPRIGSLLSTSNTHSRIPRLPTIR